MGCNASRDAVGMDNVGKGVEVNRLELGLDFFPHRIQFA